MIEVTSTIGLDEKELDFDFVRASGPGGQNVNKVATAVQLRFNVENSQSLPEEVRDRLKKTAGRRINAEGVLVIEAKRYRSQARNREDAVHRLVAWIRQAARKPKSRRRTRPSAAARERRLEEKRQRSEIKRKRRPPRRPGEES